MGAFFLGKSFAFPFEWGFRWSFSFPQCDRVGVPVVGRTVFRLPINQSIEVDILMKDTPRGNVRRAADGDVKPGLGFSEVGNSNFEVPEAQEVTPVGPAYL